MVPGPGTEPSAEGGAGERDEEARGRLHGRLTRDAGLQEDVCRDQGSCQGMVCLFSPSFPFIFLQIDYHHFVFILRSDV